MINENITDIVSQSYSALGKLSLKIVRNIDNGYGNSQAQDMLWSKATLIRKVLKVVMDHTQFDDNGVFVRTLNNTSDATINKFLRVLISVTDINDYSTAPVLQSKVKPNRIVINEPGAQGPPGPPGSNANIVVEPDTGELQIGVSSADVGLVKHFKLKFTAYTPPALQVALDAPKTYEIGTVVGVKTITITTTKGKQSIQSMHISDGTLDTYLQSILNFVTLNGVTQPVATGLNPTNVAASITYTVTVVDDSGLPAGTVVASDSLSFIYPFLFGATNNQGDDPYLNLTKKLEPKADKAFLLNGTVKYFWIGYPASYGVASQILDQNGFDVIGSFDTFTQTVNSVGLTNNYSVSFRFYRTTLKTTIANANYTLKF